MSLAFLFHDFIALILLVCPKPPYIKDMNFIFTPILSFVLWIFGSFVIAQTPTFNPVAAQDVTKEELLYEKRALVIFANSDRDPNFIRQLELLAEDPAALSDRDVVVIIDATPKLKSAWRKALRPNGFSLLIFDKDGSRALRKPLPWNVREISRSIDKFPSRRIEISEQNPTWRQGIIQTP
ncbi:MAG: hypothetical protein ACI9O0_001221 [Paracoccaceae bacterium]